MTAPRTHAGSARAVAVATTSIVLAACTNTSATTGTYTLSFQSTQEAVAVEAVRILVFDAAGKDVATMCTDLLSRRASRQDLPAPIAEVPARSVCDLQKGTGSFDAPFGTVAVLALATRGTQDLARGCATQRFDKGAANVTIEMSLAVDQPGLSVPDTTCTSLSQHCSGGCP